MSPRGRLICDLLGASKEEVIHSEKGREGCCGQADTANVGKGNQEGLSPGSLELALLGSGLVSVAAGGDSAGCFLDRGFERRNANRPREPDLLRFDNVVREGHLLWIRGLPQDVGVALELFLK